jgi:cyclohexanecarboxylate-CoA ligase
VPIYETSSPDQIRWILEDSGARAVVAETPDHVARLSEVRAGLAELNHVWSFSDNAVDILTRLGQDISEDELERRRTKAGPDDLATIIYTSGTTGEPKGVMHTHNTLMAANAPLPERLGVGPDSVIHMASTFAHLTGFLYGVRLPVQVGGAMAVYQDVWDAARFVELIAEHGITYTSAATPFLHDLLSAPNLAEHDVSSLVRFCCMGAPIPRAKVREAKEKLPDLAVLGGWGQSEDALVTLGIPGDPEEKIVERDGYPWPGMRIRVVDHDRRELPAGEEGRLQVAGPFLFVGYFRRLEMTRESFDGEWFDTGDVAVIDADGYLSITGRSKDVIIRGGENLPVAYIENVLYEDPRIHAVALIGIPDPRLQERACAVVVPAVGTEVTLEGIGEFLEAKGVTRHYWPERLELVDELPRTPSGKIQKYALRERFAGAPAQTDLTEA